MEAKNLFVYPIEEISAEELCQLQKAITDELNDRRSRAKQTAWHKVVAAIKEYTTTFGDIEITTDCDTFYLTNFDDYSSFGEIRLKFE